MAVVVDAAASELDAVLKQHKEPLFLLFLGDKIPSVGHSWCPDCVRAEPVIYKEVEDSPTAITLVRINVGDRATWRNPLHPLRSDPRFQLKGVPTLVRWENGKVAARLEDHEAHIALKVKELISSKQSSPQ